MLKKTFVGFSVAILVFSGLFGILGAERVEAAAKPKFTPPEGGIADTGEKGARCLGGLLNFRAWFQGLTVDVDTCAIFPPCARDEKTGDSVKDNECMEITVFVWTIALNILFNLFLAVGYLAIGFLMLGGYWYILAQGNQSKIERGKKTIISAITGLTIAVFATIISNTIVAIVSNGSRQQWGKGDDGSELLGNILHWAYIALGALGVIMMIYAGFQWITSAGDAGKARTARMTMIYAAIGIAVVVTASVITGLIVGAAG